MFQSQVYDRFLLKKAFFGSRMSHPLSSTNKPPDLERQVIVTFLPLRHWVCQDIRPLRCISLYILIYKAGLVLRGWMELVAERKVCLASSIPHLTSNTFDKCTFLGFPEIPTIKIVLLDLGASIRSLSLIIDRVALVSTRKFKFFPFPIREYVGCTAGNVVSIGRVGVSLLPPRHCLFPFYPAAALCTQAGTDLPVASAKPESQVVYGVHLLGSLA